MCYGQHTIVTRRDTDLAAHLAQKAFQMISSTKSPYKLTGQRFTTFLTYSWISITRWPPFRRRLRRRSPASALPTAHFRHPGDPFFLFTVQLNTDTAFSKNTCASLWIFVLLSSVPRDLAHPSGVGPCTRQTCTLSPTKFAPASSFLPRAEFHKCPSMHNRKLSCDRSYLNL